MDPAATPPLLPLLLDFLLTVLMSFLLGLGLREYYLFSGKGQFFGSTRTCTLIGILGFVLFRAGAGGLLYFGGMLVLGLLLALYYQSKLVHQQVGMIGILMALLSYLVGPIALELPDWFLILYVITALFVLNAKEKIHLLTEKLAREEIITLARFLVLSGVILPLTPKEPIADFVPVSMHQTWMAVVVISGISYLGYLIQTYLLKGEGMLLTGAIGGIYSSTAATVVVARHSSQLATASPQPAAAIILATALMYPRLLVVVAIFNPPLSLHLAPCFLALAAIAAGWAFLVNRDHGGNGQGTVAAPPNPLELSSALLFAALFVALSAANQYILREYAHTGLQWMSFLAGLADIDPFVMSLLQGNFSAPSLLIGKAIVIAAGSNNLLKACYAAFLGEHRTGRLAGTALTVLGALTLSWGIWAD
ncbi:MAG: DUF4010 domain-containing protein [Methylococcaceae bacterium]|nr:DUF4010 domain-containing protein [Methylococcaceae bacterium]